MSSDPAAYDAVLRDLREKRAQIDSAIEAIETIRPRRLTIGGEPIRRPPEPKLVARSTAGPPTIIGGALEILRFAGEPLHVSEIVKRLTNMGVKMESEDDANTVGSILNRRHRKKGDVVRVGRGTWALAEPRMDISPLERELLEPFKSAGEISLD
jgi:hypothetical protein